MIRYIKQAVILTSETPEAFINFGYDPADGSVWYIIPQQNTSASDGLIFVNGLDINGGIDPSNLHYEPSINYAVILDSIGGDPSIASFLISSNIIGDFDYNLIFEVFDVSAIDSSVSPIMTLDVSIYNRPSKIPASSINSSSTTNVQVDGETSYLLTRTNPKFSGNIKLIADSSNRFYLDTFKISDPLSNKKYRKQSVSGNSTLSGDIRKVFESLPEGELYRLDDENTLDISIPKTNYSDQYDLNYSYGARLFKDELYSEDYSLLAPLWINKDLPSYFAIFKIDGVYNPETYARINLENLGKKYLEEGKLVKTWSLKENSPLGTYLRNHLGELLKYRAPVFLSLTDPDAVDFDPNTWYGIAVDKGIMAGRSEVPYFFNQKTHNFTDMNAFISAGFERNNLLCPNLINLEYAFDDEDVSMYSMNRYFGLYLTENELYRISYYSDISSGTVSIISLDGRDPSIFFDSSIFAGSGEILSSYKNRIWGLDDILSFNRITQKSQADGTNYDSISEWVNKPGSHLFGAETEQKQFNNFISFKINNLLEAGEQLRLINKTKGLIWEVYGIGSDILEAGESWTYASHQTNLGYPEVYRVPFSIKGEIEDQIFAIQNAFDVFVNYSGTPFRTGIRKSDSLSLVINDEFIGDQFEFQRLTSNTTTTLCDSSIGSFNGAAKPSDITFFGRYTPVTEDISIISCEASYGPINFEIYGVRESITINLIDPSGYYIYSIDSSHGKEFSDYVLYQSKDDGWYRLIQSMSITINDSSTHSYLYVDDPVELDNNIIVISEHPIDLIHDFFWNAYDVYPLSISLMGINPVKDFDFTVYDSNLGYESNYWYSREDDASTYEFRMDASSFLNINSRGSFEFLQGDGSIYIGADVSHYVAGMGFNTFFSEASIFSRTVTKIRYDINRESSAFFPSYKAGESEESINNYYLDSVTKKTLKYGLTVPVVSKWAGLGSDCRGNPLRLILDGSIFDSSTNFIPYNGNFENEISYPIFKYLDPGDRAWENYIYYDVNDLVTYNLDGSIKTTNIRQFIFDNPEIDVFSKLVYSNKNVSGTSTRSSIVYYNQYKDRLEGIITGLNINFELSSSAKNLLNLKDWNRYRFSFISTISPNPASNSPMEVIINENTETILIIWYQGNDLLNYTYKDSSTITGKGILSSDISTLTFSSYITGPNWSFVKAPYYIKTSTAGAITQNTFGRSTTGYSSKYASYIGQLNNNISSSINSAFITYGEGTVSIGGSLSYYAQYNTFSQYIDYEYNPFSSTIGKNVLNRTYLYLNNDNLYSGETTNLDTLKYILSQNQINYYILRSNEVFNNDTFGIQPINMSLTDPRFYKPSDSSVGIYTYLGWYRPKFNNLFDFNSNEDPDLINIIDKDFTLGNTYFKGYRNIPQFWYNKVVGTVTQNDVDNANAINYLDEFNIFKSQWDYGYYILNNGATEIPKSGVNSTLELPSFFGSKLIKLPDRLNLSEWDNTTASSVEGRNWHTLSFNLTRGIINTFKSNINFTDNWSGLGATDQVIDGYIKDTIVNYYNITRAKILVQFYSKPYDGKRLYFELDNSFDLEDKSNLDGILNFINGNYVYDIKVNLIPNRSYYISFTLVEK